MTNSFGIKMVEVTPKTELNKIFPRKTRNSQVKELEKHLGFELSLLRPPHFVTGFLMILLLGSFILLFIDWKYGLSTLGLAIVGFWISNKTSNELDLVTVRELVARMTKENYIKSRRNSQTINKNGLI